jgi:hypothetical protein
VFRGEPRFPAIPRLPSLRKESGRCQATHRCREHARRCSEIASHATSPEIRDHFTSLEQSWLRLAADIESGQKLLDVIDEISRGLVPRVEAAE